MTTADVTRKIIRRYIKLKWLIIAVALVFGVLLYMYAKTSPAIYTSNAKVFPINGSNDKVSTSSAISQLLGGDVSKSFSEDASINIVELAQSRRIHEAVAKVVVDTLGNKTIAALLIEDVNTHRPFYLPKIKLEEKDKNDINRAVEIIRASLNPSVNKNNMLVLTYSGYNPSLVRVISYNLVEKISQFYIDLKIEKAKMDFDFATKKVDSLRRVMNIKDYQLIAIDRKTMFTNPERVEYTMPSENLIADKMMIRNQYAQAVTNQQTAAYKLQKSTPIIKILDSPEPPYEYQKKSGMLFGILGFILGTIFSLGMLATGPVIGFVNNEINKFTVVSKTTETQITVEKSHTV